VIIDASNNDSSRIFNIGYFTLIQYNPVDSVFRCRINNISFNNSNLLGKVETSSIVWHGGAILN